MGFKVTLGSAAYFTKLSVRLAYSWPPPPSATKWEKTKFEGLWILSLVSAFGFLASLVYSIYEFPSDSMIITKITCVGAISGFIVKIVVCRIHRNRIQTVIHGMEKFGKKARDNDRAVLQRYVDQCSSIHITITVINYLTPVLVFCGTFLKPDEILPAPGAYPFSVKSGPMLYIVCIHQYIAAFQCSAGATVDCQTAMMMWYVGARLEMLAAELENICDSKMLRKLVRKHQKLLGLAHDVKSTMSYIALTTTTTSGIATVCSCLQLVSDEPMAVKMQFGPVAVISIICLFVCAWPADNIITVCDNVGAAAYNSPWLDMSPKLRMHILMILRRSQKPVTASIGGFIPVLSLRYYASFLSAAFSYFTTLSATMIAKEP